MKKLAIFDLDGTLLNTISDLGMATNHALEKNGFPKHDIDVYPTLVGNGVRKLIERSLPVEHRNSKTITRLLDDFKEYYNVHKTDLTKPYDGILSLLAELRDMDVALAVASNKYQEATEGLIRHFFGDSDFVAVEGQKQGIPVKPDPSIVFEIINKAQITKADTVYIGDSAVDMNTARRACVDSIGVTWGFRSRAELSDNYATYIATEPQQILDIVRGINLINYYNK